MANTTIVGAALGAVLGFVCLIVVLALVFFFCCCAVSLEEDGEDYAVLKLHFKVCSRSGIHPRSGKGPSHELLSLEKEIESDGTFPNPKNEKNSKSQSRSGSNSSKGRTKKELSTNDDADKAENWQCKSDEKVFKELNVLTQGLFDESKKKANSKTNILNSGRMTFLVRKLNDDNSHLLKTCPVAIIKRAPECLQSYISDQYASFNRSLLLQSLIENSINSPKFMVLTELKDFHLDGMISVGGIAVVVEKFQGNHDFEFKSLNPGDLLHVVKFYIREKIDSDKGLSSNDRRSLFGDPKDSHCPKNNEACEPRYDLLSDESSQSAKHVDYDRIYCTGVLLKSYLDYENSSKGVCLRSKKKNGKANEFEILKDFPLKVVSLKTANRRRFQRPVSH